MGICVPVPRKTKNVEQTQKNATHERIIAKGTVESCGKSRDLHDKIKITKFNFSGEGKAKFSFGKKGQKKLGTVVSGDNKEFIEKNENTEIILALPKGKK